MLVVLVAFAFQLAHNSSLLTTSQGNNMSTLQQATEGDFTLISVDAGLRLLRCSPFWPSPQA